MNRSIRILAVLLAVLFLTAGLAGCGKKRAVILLDMEIQEAPEGTVIADRVQTKELGERVVFTIRANEGYIPYALNFFNEDGQIVTASYYIEGYRAEDFINLNPDGSYTLDFDVGAYFFEPAEHDHEHAEEGHAEYEYPEETIHVRILPQFISLDLPEVKVEAEQPHSAITVFPKRGAKGTNVKIVIGTEPGWEVTACSHNGKEFPVDEPLASYDDAVYHYVSFSFYMKEEDEIVRYEVGESK